MEDYSTELDCQDEFADWYFGYEEMDQTSEPLPKDELRLWQLFSELEPNLTTDELEELDRIADDVD